LSHQYPFHINMNLTKSYALAKGGGSSFEVSISWPLDSDNDTSDSLWGTKAYNFTQNEESIKNGDPNYQIRPPIQVVISVNAEQYLEESTSSDTRYNLGDTILFDVINNAVCTEVSSTCLKTYVIDVNNKLGDGTVTLLPDPNGTYVSSTFSNYNLTFGNITNGWVVSTRSLLVEDLLKVVSTDVINSFLVRDNISNLIIGNLGYDSRMNTEIAKAISYNGYYSFLNTKFSYFPATSCYWTSSEYNSVNGFALEKVDENTSKIYGKDKTSSCNVIPVILVNKSNL